MEGTEPNYVEVFIERDGTIIHAGPNAGTASNFLIIKNLPPRPVSVAIRL